MDKKQLELMRRFISVLPEERLAKVLRQLMLDEPLKPPPRRMPSPPTTPPKQ